MCCSLCSSETSAACWVFPALLLCWWDLAFFVQVLVVPLMYWFRTSSSAHISRTMKSFHIVTSPDDRSYAVCVAMSVLVHIQRFMHKLPESMQTGVRKVIVKGAILPFVLFPLRSTWFTIQESIEKFQRHSSDAVRFGALCAAWFVLHPFLCSLIRFIITGDYNHCNRSDAVRFGALSVAWFVLQLFCSFFSSVILYWIRGQSKQKTKITAWFTLSWEISMGFIWLLLYLLVSSCLICLFLHCFLFIFRPLFKAHTCTEAATLYSVFPVQLINFFISNSLLNQEARQRQKKQKSMNH